MAITRKSCAIYIITKHGLKHGRRLQEAWPDADVYVSEKVEDGSIPGALRCRLPLTPLLQETFTQYNCHIFVISVGAVVRMIAPLIHDKKVDPAVVCVDDAARYAIALLSGHIGRGNEWTDKVAHALQAEAVITTASDVQGTLTVDILGRDLGWVLEDMHHNVTPACAAVVNERPVLIIQECGEPHFWPESKALPPGVRYTTHFDGLEPNAWEMLLIVSDRDIPCLYPEAYARGVVYRPKSLWLGIGCDRGAPRAFLERGIRALLQEFQLSWKAIAGLTSVDLKADEAGLIELCQAYGWEFRTYPSEELREQTGIENPSARVASFTGTPSVSEAACLRAAGVNQLLVPKQKYKEADVQQAMTFAVARTSFAPRKIKGD